MSVSNFIKQNFALVLGIALPVLLVGGFMLMAALPQKQGTPPEYTLLFSATKYQNNASGYNVDYVVKSGKVYARLTERKDNYSNYQRELFRFDGKTGSVQKIEPTLPDDLGEEKKLDVELEEFKNITLDTSSKSPDGYSLENSGYRSRGITGMVFGGGSGRYETILRHEKGYVVKLPEYSGSHYYGNLDFIGWVIPKKQ
ncbi:MAG: hypothetical protein Q8K65_05845 [Alphaproteobacteria bacterium]|nr:hypothetical protein [Alphaproteobacteria bacterium]